MIGGTDDLIGDRVERGARLLEGELHRASPLHTIRGDKGRGETFADDQQTVVAQDQDVAMTEIGEEASSFLGVSAVVVVIGDVSDHLQACWLSGSSPSVCIDMDHGAVRSVVGIEGGVVSGC